MHTPNDYFTGVAVEGPTAPAAKLPPKYDVLGVKISATTYDQALDAVASLAVGRESSVMSLHAVHALVTVSSNPRLREAVNQFEVVAPDGQPVRWALNWLHKASLKERVYGPEFMLRLCARAADEEIPVYLYGSTESVLAALQQTLLARHPSLRIAGVESPPFRELTREEDNAVVERINASGAGIVFIGLGAPKQDVFAAAHRDRIHAVQVCVGAAFDFHAGLLPMAPIWMQRCGLEWSYRLFQEPRRLWRRYAITNTAFLARLLFALLRKHIHPHRTDNGQK